MNDAEARSALIRQMVEKANLAIAAARREAQAGDLALAMNRVYYACFYAASAVLTHEQRRFGRHSSVRAAVHQHLVKTGRLAPELGRFYDDAFDDRQEADYGAVAEFDSLSVQSRIEIAERFVGEMKRLIAR